jgi:hypothetical protein
MSKAGETIENPVTKERKVVRVGTEDCAGRLLTVDGYVQPGGAVAGEHVHPDVHGGEQQGGLPLGRARVDRASGRAGARAARHGPRLVERRAGGGTRGGRDRPGARYEEMALNLFGLAQNGQTNPKGMPGLFWAAIFAREFADV